VITEDPIVPVKMEDPIAPVKIEDPAAMSVQEQEEAEALTDAGSDNN